MLPYILPGNRALKRFKMLFRIILNKLFICFLKIFIFLTTLLHYSQKFDRFFELSLKNLLKHCRYDNSVKVCLNK